MGSTKILIDTVISGAKVSNAPNECPYCRKALYPYTLEHYLIEKNLMTITFQCASCDRVFLGIYDRFNSESKNNHKWILSETYPHYKDTRKFSIEIHSISENFCKYYSQAEKIEFQGLDACGMIYRKALEFLIKDYAISQKPNDIKSVENMPLKQCIDKYFEDEQLKLALTGACYLGNDEVHYVKKHKDMGVEDLKILIDMSVHFIQMKELLKKYKEVLNLDKKKDKS